MVYCEYFGLNEKPFNVTPDPRYIFLSASHREALAHLLYGIDNRTGFIELTGEVGAGKTTVLRTLLSQLDPERYRTALIFNPCLSAPELLQAINREFQISSDDTSQSKLLDTLNQFLIRKNEEGRIVVLVIDEAQNLQPEVLEQIRLISNLETEREKLLQIVLAGQPELGRLLERKEMRQIDQRIAVRYHLPPMTFEDTMLYLHHRLNVAGSKGNVSFSHGAAKRLYRYSGGLPRLINIAGDRALLAAYTRNTRQITAPIASEGITDVKRGAAPRTRQRIAGAGALALVLAAAAAYFFGSDFRERLRPLTPVEATVSVAEKNRPAEQASFGKLEQELRGLSEEASALAAFGMLRKAWKTTPVEGPLDLNHPQVMERDGMSLYRFSGNLGSLLRLDSPAILDLRLPGIPERRYVTLMGIKDGLLLIALNTGETTVIPPVDIETFWSGQGMILWKNALGLPSRVYPGANKEHVRELQRLLTEAGVYTGPESGIYDGPTGSAVRKFQAAKGLEQDGIAGRQTQILLYRSISRFETPGLLR
jgi:general secretion pathway protein A